MKKSFWYLTKLKLEIFTSALIGAHPDCEVLDADDKWEIANSSRILPTRLDAFYSVHDNIDTASVAVIKRIDHQVCPKEVFYSSQWWKLISAGEALTKSSNFVFSVRCKRTSYVRIQLRSFYLEGKLHRIALWDYI